VQDGQNQAFLTPALLKYSAAYAAYVAFLHAVDGPWRNWKVGREGQALDGWTIQHVLWGALGAYVGLTPKQVLILSTVNELVEYGVRTYRPDLLWGSPESPQNVFMDLAATLAGWKIAELIAKRT
jgi:hypothetical protein